MVVYTKRCMEMYTVLEWQMQQEQQQQQQQHAQQ